MYCFHSIGSEREKAAIKNAYIAGRGRINYVMKHVPFLLSEDQTRVTAMIEGILYFASDYFPFLILVSFFIRSSKVEKC